MLACPPRCTFRIEIRILIERDLPRRVLVAEDVAAMSAVVPSLEEAEGFVADWVVADGGVGVRFPVVPCGWASDRAKVVVFLCDVLLVFGHACEGTRLLFSAVCGGAPAYGSTCSVIDEAVGAAVDTARWGEGRGSWCSVCGALGGPQCSGNEHGRFGGAEGACCKWEVGEIGRTLSCRRLVCGGCMQG